MHDSSAIVNPSPIVSKQLDERSDPQIGHPVKWQPRWEVNLSHDSKLGIAIDDGCFVVLYPTEDGGWQPGTHMPKSVAERIVRLTQEGILR